MHLKSILKALGSVELETYNRQCDRVTWIQGVAVVAVVVVPGD